MTVTKLEIGVRCCTKRCGPKRPSKTKNGQTDIKPQLKSCWVAQMVSLQKLNALFQTVEILPLSPQATFAI